MNDTMPKIPVHDIPHIKFNPLPPGTHTPWDDIEEAEEYDKFTMQSIKAVLDESVIGQEAAKKALSQVVWSTFEVGPDTCLLVGPTGCGKTQLLKAIAQEYPRLCTWADCSMLSSEGFKGEYKLSTVLKSIPRDGHPKLLILDEFDKVLDIKGTECYHLMLQNEMLKLFDHDPGIFADCISPEKLTIVCMGAFSDIRDRKKKSHPAIGFSNTVTENEADPEITIDDLKNMGFREELLGRFSRVVFLESISKQNMRIIVDAEQKKLATLMKREILLDDHTKDTIAQVAFDSGLGARKVRSQLRCLAEDYIYDHPDATTIDLTLREETPDLPYMA